ncbi:WAP four-disulfide core domain protein 8 isoform X2 [Talpa occidentalis]|uniref:WAP four-disulfide core domain protein 8 isoform X2 n=1 Tax=Talpa occidentalis TaxID=50954 RepID=UPI0023F65B20|nr:WAP four-disulfide core domain protein 8 isoform X2 [Talpa occidentalis]
MPSGYRQRRAKERKKLPAVQIFPSVLSGRAQQPRPGGRSPSLWCLLVPRCWLVAGDLSIPFLDIHRFFDCKMLLSLQPRATSATWRSWEKRHLPLHSSSFPWKNVALLLMLSLSLEQTSAVLLHKVKKKVGTCPQERLICRTKVPDVCRIDLDCHDYLKCCSFNCGRRCLDPFQEPCMLPKDSGKCKSNQLRWHFDMEKRLCQSFTYQGCHGNANNFFTLEDCEKACLLTVKDGECPPMPTDCLKINRPTCLKDSDCPLTEKCCSRCGLICLNPNEEQNPGHSYGIYYPENDYLESI